LARARPAASLVEDDEFHLIEAAEQLVFQLADDPGDFRGGPVVLDGPDDGHHVSRVAQR
jgi:hypothetical protein